MATATIEVTDWLALKARIDTLVTDPAMQVIEPGATFTAPKDGSGKPLPYILVSDVRNETQRIGVDPRLHIRSGTLMLSVQIPIALPNWDHARIVQIGGTIAAHFKADTPMCFGASRLRVRRDADALQPDRDGDNRTVLVRVPWWNQ